MRSDSKQAHQNQNKFMRIITVPIRALGKVKDFYVRSMTDVADRVSYGGSAALGGPGGQYSTGLPKSFSTRSSSSRDGSDDFSELMRAASARSYGGRIDVDKILQEQMMMRRSATTTSMGSRQVLPKCGSVAMGRIDEDAPCEFEEEGGVPKDMYLRSRSHAVGKRSVAFV